MDHSLGGLGIVHQFAIYGHPILTLMSLKGVLEHLPESTFSRIHRSYIICDAQVISIQNKKVRLLSGGELPVSDSYLHLLKSGKT